MEFSPPDACIYRISLYCPMNMHTYLLMWNELICSNHGVDEELTIYIDEDSSIKRFSKRFELLLEECLNLQKIGCLEITSITGDSVYLTLCDVTDESMMMDLTEDTQ